MLGTKILLVLSLVVFVKMEEKSSNPTYCPEKNGVYPFASKTCKEYIVCNDGTAHHMICDKGLAYNTVKRSCDLKKNVICNPDEKPQAPVPAAQEVICPEQNGTFPVSCGDCRKYMLCNRGNPTLMECPLGLVYDQTKRSCDWSWNVICNPVGVPPPTSGSSSTPVLQSPSSPAPGFPIDFNCQQRNGYNAIYNKCDTYIICREYVAYRALCPHGLQFNPEARWPDNACSYAPRINCAVNSIAANQYPWQYGFYSMPDWW